MKRCNFKITDDLTRNAFCCMKHYNYFKEKAEPLGLNLTPSKKGTKNKLINTIKSMVREREIKMIFITGDTHIPLDISKLNTTLFPQQSEMTKDDYVIILGDFGLYWHEDKTFRYWHKWLQEKPWTTLWLDGNHENHDWINRMEVSQWHGGKVHKDGSIIHLMRGQIYEIEGHTFFVLGGADSTDKEHRNEGLSWWPQEVPSFAEFNEAIDNLEKAGNKADYILTHTCPIDLINQMFHLNPIGNNTVEKALQTIYNRKPEFKRWFFGHWHQSRKYGNFFCLYDRIVNLDKI